MKLCDFPGCTKGHCARGLCNGHYNQQRRGEELRPLRPHTGPRPICMECAIPGCERPRQITVPRKLCGVHNNILCRISMARNRCTSTNDEKYDLYGGRGIECLLPVTHEGVAMLCGAIGEPEQGQSLDRIDVNGNYEVANLRWATAKEQMANRQAPTTREWVNISARFPMAAEYLSELRA